MVLIVQFIKVEEEVISFHHNLTVQQTFDLPAYHPTAVQLSVAVLIAPEIGGPISAPIAQMLHNIPVLLPKSPISPNAG